MSYWFEKYIGTPWMTEPNPPESFNCAELARWVLLKEKGIDTAGVFANAAILRQCVDNLRDPGIYGLVPLPEGAAIQDFDICYLARMRYFDHVGIAANTVDGLMVLHCLTGPGTSLDTLAAMRAWGYYRVRWYRHEKLMKEAVVNG